MEFIGKPINNCYLLQENLGENEIFSTWRAKAMYSPNNFSISFFNFLKNDPPAKVLQSFEDLFFRIYNFDNSYILAPFEYSSYENTRFMASNWIEGYSLRQVMDKGLIVSFDQVMNIIIFLLRGLYSLEQAGIHHNSLSPRAIVVPDANIEYGRIKLRNIGVSLFVDAFPEGRYVQKIKPYYLSAEKYPEGPWRDLYAVSVITLELLQLVPESDGDPEQKATILEIAQKTARNPKSVASIEEALNTIVKIHPEKELIDHLNEHAKARLEARDFSDILKRIRSGETISSEEDFTPPETPVPLLRPAVERVQHTPSPDGNFYPEGVSPPPEREGFISRVVSAFQRLIRGKKLPGKTRKNKPGYSTSDEPELLMPLEDELEPLPPNTAGKTPADSGSTPGITGSLHEPDTDKEARRNRVAEVLRRLQDHFSGLTGRLVGNENTQQKREKRSAPMLPIDKNRRAQDNGQPKPLAQNRPGKKAEEPKENTKRNTAENPDKEYREQDRETYRHPGFAQRKAEAGAEYLFGEGTPDLTGEFLDLEGEGGLGEGSAYKNGEINTERTNPEEHTADEDQLITGDLHNRAGKKREDRNLDTVPGGVSDASDKGMESSDSGTTRQGRLESVSGSGSNPDLSENITEQGSTTEKELADKDSILPPTVDQPRPSADISEKQGFFARLRHFVKKVIRRVTSPFRK